MAQIRRPTFLGQAEPAAASWGSLLAIFEAHEQGRGALQADWQARFGRRSFAAQMPASNTDTHFIESPLLLDWSLTASNLGRAS